MKWARDVFLVTCDVSTLTPTRHLGGVKTITCPDPDLKKYNNVREVYTSIIIERFELQKVIFLFLVEKHRYFSLYCDDILMWNISYCHSWSLTLEELTLCQGAEKWALNNDRGVPCHNADSRSFLWLWYESGLIKIKMTT